MKDISIEEALTAFGLSLKEIKIYLACLELGTATANVIANKSKINRSTTYDILKAFLEKGIASKTIREKTTNFEVASPKRLLTILDEKKTKLHAVLDKLQLIEERVVKKPVIKVYDGHEGIKTILENILSSKLPIDVISTSKIFEVFKFYFPHYIKQRNELKIPTRVIQESSPQTKNLKKKDKEQNRKTRSLKNFNMNSVTFICGKKIAMIRLIKKELLGVLILDETIAKDQKRIFEALWRNAK